MSGTWSPRGPCIACDSYTQYASVSVSPVARPVGVTSVVSRWKTKPSAAILPSITVRRKI